MRLFTAIELPDSAREHLLDIQENLHNIASGVSWTRAENLHLTLKFIGEMVDERVNGLCRRLHEISVRPMRLRTSDMVLFPPRGGVRIIACGFAGEIELSRSLQARIEAQCALQGIAREMRSFTPHVTLARARHPLGASVREQLLREKIADGPAFECQQFVLMQSHLESSGARYQVVARFGQT